MNCKFLIVGLVATTILLSCGETSSQIPSNDFGELTYRPPFPCESLVLCDGDTSFLEKTFCFEFNEDAESEGEMCYALFEFVDNDGREIPPTELNIVVKGDGEKIAGCNKFKVDAKGRNTGIVKKEVTITFRYLPEAKEGKHQGLLRVYHHNLLDRIDNHSLDQNSKTIVDILQWSIVFNKKWNKLALVLIYVGLFLLLLAMIRIIYVRRPSVRLNTKLFYMQDGYEELLVKLDNCTKGVITNSKKSQGLLSKLFNGKYCYSIPMEQIQDDIHILVESSDVYGNKVLKLRSHGHYLINGVKLNEFHSISKDSDNEYSVSLSDNYLLTIKYM